MTEQVNLPSFFERLREKFDQLADEFQLKGAEVNVRASVLNPEEAIGATKRKDYVLLKGKERLLQAEVMGCKGQAFTSAQGDFDGTLGDVLAMPLTDDFQRAVYVATFNAVTCYTGKATDPIHCRDEGPEICARKVVEYFQKNYGHPRILMIGFQPALAEALHEAFPLIVLDLDPANIGRTKKGVLIKDGIADLDESMASSDVIFSTGSTICNNSIDVFLKSGKPLVLYGTTGAGAASLLGIPRFCPESFK